MVGALCVWGKLLGSAGNLSSDFSSEVVDLLLAGHDADLLGKLDLTGFTPFAVACSDHSIFDDHVIDDKRIRKIQFDLNTVGFSMRSEE